ncbi:hypothetical protein VWM73_11715, partial [Campylobacter coli]
MNVNILLLIILLIEFCSLSLYALIYPLFVVNGKGIKKEISSMPDVFQMSLDEILKECKIISELGI